MRTTVLLFFAALAVTGSHAEAAGRATAKKSEADVACYKENDGVMLKVVIADEVLMFRDMTNDHFAYAALIPAGGVTRTAAATVVQPLTIYGLNNEYSSGIGTYAWRVTSKTVVVTGPDGRSGTYARVACPGQ